MRLPAKEGSKGQRDVVGTEGHMQADGRMVHRLFEADHEVEFPLAGLAFDDMRQAPALQVRKRYRAGPRSITPAINFTFGAFVHLIGNP